MKTIIVLGIVFVIVAALAIWGWRHDVAVDHLDNLPPIRIGFVHSTTGPFAAIEQPMLNAELLAVDKINEEGGLLGRRVDAVVRDGKSDPREFAAAAENLIGTEKVCAVVGCYTTSSRVAVKAVVEKYNHLLVYPTNYEGLEQSPNIVYTGAAPNQQITPSVAYMINTFQKKRFFLVGTDSVWAHMVNAQVRDNVKALGGQVVGEEYLPIESVDVVGVVDRIKENNSDLIVSTVDGSTGIAFFRELAKEDVKPDKTPVLALSIAEDGLRVLGPQVRKNLEGNYGAWSYFQSLESPENAEFVRRYKEKYGADKVTDCLSECGYVSVLLIAQSIRSSGSPDVGEIRSAILDQSMAAPEGIISIDRATHHSWKVVRIGKIRADGQYDQIWTSDKPIRPVPFPVSRTHKEWTELFQDVNARWIATYAPTSTISPANEKK